MKRGKPKPPQKRVRFFRISDSMWADLNRLAAAREMTASEYVRRIIEGHLLEHAGRVVKGEL